MKIKLGVERKWDERQFLGRINFTIRSKRLIKFLELWSKKCKTENRTLEIELDVVFGNDTILR